MKNAREVNARYFSPDMKLYKLTEQERLAKEPDAKLAELGYCLNYLEFISAAVKSADLDEKLMRQTLRGMSCNFYEVAEDYIASTRQNSPLSFEHLAWLMDNLVRSPRSSGKR